MCFIQVTMEKNTGYMTETEREREGWGTGMKKSLKRKVLESLLGVSFW